MENNTANKENENIDAGAKQPVLNREQEAAAFCEENAVVAAGAGSGKTMVLASRYAWLVTEKKYRVSEILTLTYTKKAAAQMYRRIYLQLSEISREDSDGKGGQRARLARQALDEFTRARIQTLDSYSAAIVKQAANRYGLSPDFTIDEDRCYDLALDEARPFLIAHRNHPAIERLYPHKNPVRIAEELFVPALMDFIRIESSPDPKRDLAEQYAIISGAWKKRSGEIKKMLNDLSDEYSRNEKCHPDLGPLLGQFNAGKIIFPGETDIGNFFNTLMNIPDTSAIQWAESHPLHKTFVCLLDFIASLNRLSLAKRSPRDNPAKVMLKELRGFFKEFSSIVVFFCKRG